jgi:hypothetical protein
MQPALTFAHRFQVGSVVAIDDKAQHREAVVDSTCHADPVGHRGISIPRLVCLDELLTCDLPTLQSYALVLEDAALEVAAEAILLDYPGVGYGCCGCLVHRALSFGASACCIHFSRSPFLTNNPRCAGSDHARKLPSRIANLIVISRTPEYKLACLIVYIVSTAISALTLPFIGVPPLSTA